MHHLLTLALAAAAASLALPVEAADPDPEPRPMPASQDRSAGANLENGLIGRWRLRGDCRDSSGNDLHAVNHGVDLANGAFDGRGAHISVPAAPALDLGTRNFSLSVWIHTEEDLDDVIGDIAEIYDPAARRGITLSVHSSSSGYVAPGNDRRVAFGIDNARLEDWQDRGRPSPTSRYVSNSLVVYKGSLYAGTTDAEDPKDWCHVYRYDSGQSWVDCGRLGEGKTTGAGPLFVHKGDLYAVSWTYDWTRVRSGGYDPGRLYRYEGGERWVDLGQPFASRTLNCAASFGGKIYVGGGPDIWAVFVRGDSGEWRESKVFEKEGPGRCFPHPMCRFNGKLFVAFPSVYAFDGEKWSHAGVPVPPVDTLQTHSLTPYQGALCAGTWPEGKVARYLGGDAWEEMGRVGEDGTEVNSLVVYNGKLYGGSIPRAEVCRYDGDSRWTSLRRFYSPEGWRPVPPADVGGNPTREDVAAWSRVTSMTVFDGKLFAGIGNCTSSVLDSPADVRGRVFSTEAGRCVTYDHDLGPGWRHIVASRDGRALKLWIDGKLAATSAAFEPGDYDVSCGRPLRIGAGQCDTFSGKLADVRLYGRALTEAEIAKLAAEKPR